MVVTSYLPKKSAFHSLNPLVKLSMALVYAFFFIFETNLPFMALLIVITVSMAFAAKVGREFIKGFLVFITPFFFFSIILQGFFGLSIASGQVGFTYTGILLAIYFTLRAMLLISVFYFFILTTNPRDLVASLKAIRFSYKATYLLSSSLQMIPEMTRTAEKVLEAQQSRGLKLKGSIRKRLNAYIPLIGPVLMGSLVNAYEKAIALDMKGFNYPAKKTNYSIKKLSGREKAIIVIIPIVLFSVRWWLWPLLT